MPPGGVGMPKRDKEIMEKLFELKILDTSEIAFVLSCSVQVVQKRKREYEKNGTITAVKEMSWQKIKPEHREALLKYVDDHGENKTLVHFSDWLAETTGLKVSTVSISRILKAAAEDKGQERRKLRAPPTRRQSGPAWLAPELVRAEERAAEARGPAEAQCLSSAVQPQLVMQEAVQMLSQPESCQTSFAPMEVEVITEQATPTESVQEAGEV